MNRSHEVSLVSLELFFCGKWRLDEDEIIRSPLLEDILSNDTWQKDEILAAKLENFLTTVLFRSPVVFVHPFLSLPDRLLLVVPMPPLSRMPVHLSPCLSSEQKR